MPLLLQTKKQATCSAMTSISLPNDVTLLIASLLEAPDVCSLGSCSRALRSLCGCDCIWIALTRKRWPSIPLASDDLSDGSGSGGDFSSIQQWRGFYVRKHKEMATCASDIVNFVEQCSQNGSLEVGSYLKAIGILSLMDFGFKDAQLFLLSRNHGVFLNLIGLHYSVLVLGVPRDHMLEALESCQVSERQVCVSWFTLGRWFFGFRLPDEHLSRKVSLGELSVAGEEVLAVLNRGAVHEVIRVHIRPVNP